MQARLKVVQDNASLKQVKLLPITVIGRGADCHLKIASTQVSRKHCRITVTDAEVLIEDLTSSNGTFVDQQRIPSGKPLVVAPGAKLQIGPATFIVDYTPPVNLETMPTTVIKASEMPAAASTALPQKGSEASIPTVDPFAAAVAEGTAPTSQMTPFLMSEAKLPEHLPPAIVSPDTTDAAEEEATLMAPIGDLAAPELPTPMFTVATEPPPAPAVVVAAPPLMAKPVVAAAVPVAAPIPAVASAVVVPAAVVVPPAAPAPQPAANAFDFLGGAAPVAAEPAATEAFQFDLAAPQPPAAALPNVTANEPKPAAVKKPLLGLFGKKDKAAPAPVAAPAVPAPADSTAVPAPAPAAPAEPAPQPTDDPFAFLK